MRTTDNNLGACFIKDENDLNNLLKLSGKTLVDLEKENPNLLVFPSSFDLTSDKIGKNFLFSINQENGSLSTSNIMGFIGIGNTQLSISSRFYEKGNDYFLHYMLQRVFSINLLNLKFSIDNEDIWDLFLIYIFPYYLKRALSQGLYKEYLYKKYCDANLKGAVDINRHIKENIIFKGCISYNTREYTFDNKLTQLVRHTIEFIKSKNLNGVFNTKEVRDSVNIILQHTSSYSKNNRAKIISENRKPIHHPFFTEYTILQKICLRILRKKGITFGYENKNKAYGIIFDGAWLWEEYLFTILKDLKYIHPENKKRKNGISLFDDINCLRYPDFYSSDKENVLDAKYKRIELWNHNSENNEDILQIITYLHCLGSKTGALIFPTKNTNSKSIIGKLNGYGGKLYKIGFGIPESSEPYSSFSENMKTQELEFIKNIKSLNLNYEY